REALRLDPRLALAHNNLGNALADKGDPDGAIAAFREAIRLDPGFALAHNNLGFVLLRKGDLDGAVAEFREALRLDPQLAIARNNLRQAERWRELRPRLPAVAAGRAEPGTPAEAAAFAELCTQPFERRYAAAARLFGRAFAADSTLTYNPATGRRYR